MHNNHLNKHSKIICYQLAYMSKETLPLKVSRRKMEGLTINVLNALLLLAYCNVWKTLYVYCKYPNFLKTLSQNVVYSSHKI